MLALGAGYCTKKGVVMTANLFKDKYGASIASGGSWWRRVTSAALRAALCFTLPGLVACSQEPFDSQNDSTAVHTEAVVQERAVTLTLPERLRPHDVVIGASDLLELRDRSKVEGPVSTAVGGILVGSDARLRNATARGQISIGDRSHVGGNLTAGGTLTVSSSATVTGTRNADVTFGPSQEIAISFKAESMSAGPVTLEPDQVLDLTPGTYSSLALKPRSTLVLHSGVYLFRGPITLESTSILSIDNATGPTQVYFEGNLTFRGSIRSARAGLPQVLLGKLGPGSVLLDAPFLGALAAPAANVALQAARPFGHRAAIYAKTVRLEPDTIVRPYSFNWGDVDPGLEPPIPPGTPVQTLPESPIDMPVSVGTGGDGTTISSEAHPDEPVTFKLPEAYPVSGGTMGNRCARFIFQTPSAASVTCTYCGGSTTAAPNTALELNRGRTLHFQGCSDELPPSMPRTGTDFTLEVDPPPGYPVTVSSPAIAENGCSDTLEILSPTQTTQMRESFAWGGQRETTNADGTPALYYAWVLVQNQDDALNLRRLLIHVLKRPLFQEELDRFKGRCGALTNPGDGFGTFIPVLIPGATYNRLVQALSSADIQGDKSIFEAIIIRDDVPAAARNPNGSVRLDVLANSGFEYLHYEPRPFAAPADMQLDAGEVRRVLVSAMQYVGEAAREAGQFVTSTLAALDRLARGRVNVTLHLHAVTKDYAFGAATKMVRAWGPARGQPLAALDLEVSILQKLLDFPLIPTTTIGYTSETGRVHVQAVEGGDARESGLCIELKNHGAMVTDFLIATQVCDFGGLELSFNNDQELVIDIENLRVVGFYQAYDAYKWSKQIVGYTPPRARILSGYWAQTFSTKNDSGHERLYAPCLSFGSFLDEAAIGTSLTTGLLGSMFLGAPVPLDLLIQMFQAVMFTSDIVMPVEDVPQFVGSRLVMSHEYGHYLLCAMMDDEDTGAVGEMVYHAIVSGDGDNRSVPVRYVNEAFADVVAGQVAGGANYGWLENSPAIKYFGRDELFEDYCVPAPSGDAPYACFDFNQRGVTLSDNHSGTESIGRIVTLLHDMVDGHGEPLTTPVPNDASLWENYRLISNPQHPIQPDEGFLRLYGAQDSDPIYGYGSIDEHLERVALPGSSLHNFARKLAKSLADKGGDGLEDPDIYSAVNGAMESENKNWCDRCRVLALHSPLLSFDEPTVKNLLQQCLFDSEIREALGETPPDPHGRLDADSCTRCPPGQISGENGQCETCGNGIVHGNSCDYCSVDVYLDGATMSTQVEYTFDTTETSAIDSCPEVFSVAVQNPAALVARGGGLAAYLEAEPHTQANCERFAELTISHDVHPNGAGIYSPLEALGSTGAWTCPLACNCVDLPWRLFTDSELLGESGFLFSVSADHQRRLVVLGANANSPL